MSNSSGLLLVISFYLVFFFLLFSSIRVDRGESVADYGQALSKAILFLEAQRSGKLRSGQREQWRGDSGLLDGSDAKADLVGGYYTGGDNVKYGFPMAFAITTFAWGVAEFADKLQAAGELYNALAAVRWGTDYFLKASATDGVLYAEVGDGESDHACWMRPEDMTTPRTTYWIDADRPGTDLAAETAAALATAAISFNLSDPAYSSLLLERAIKVHDFARDELGVYSDSVPVAKGFYPSSGYEDELLWAAIWLHRATGNDKYLHILNNFAATGGGTGRRFSWDDKYLGVQLLVSRLILEGKIEDKDAWSLYNAETQTSLCNFIQEGGNGRNVKLTAGGMAWWGSSSNNLQYTAATLLAATVYADYLSAAGSTLPCSKEAATKPEDIIAFVSSQVNYILGENPWGRSYMVGFGSSYPQQVHHRASSMPSIKTSPAPIACLDGYHHWFNRNESNPNVLVGGVVGGPNEIDYYNDTRSNVGQAEASILNTAPLVGVLARLA